MPSLKQEVSQALVRSNTGGRGRQTVRDAAFEKRMDAYRKEFEKTEVARFSSKVITWALQATDALNRIEETINSLMPLVEKLGPPTTKAIQYSYDTDSQVKILALLNRWFAVIYKDSTSVMEADRRTITSRLDTIADRARQLSRILNDPRYPLYAFDDQYEFSYVKQPTLNSFGQKGAAGIFVNSSSNVLVRRRTERKPFDEMLIYYEIPKQAIVLLPSSFGRQTTDGSRAGTLVHEALHALTGDSSSTHDSKTHEKLLYFDDAAIIEKARIGFGFDEAFASEFNWGYFVKSMISRSL